MTWSFFPIADFKNHIETWDRLNKQNTASPALDSNFVIPLLNCFSTGKEHIAISGDILKPEAMAILYNRKFGVWETFQPSQAPLGMWLQNPSNPPQLLLSSLRKALPFPTLLIGITQQDPDILERPSNCKNVSTLDYIQTARVTINDGFNNYWAQRGKNLRQNLNRQRNRLAREGIQTELKIITSPDEISQAINDYGRLESAGWKNTGGTAIHIDNQQGKFYCDMLTRFSQHQNALIFQYYYNDQLVAIDLCIKDDTSLIILKTTYDESITTSSPALLMRQESFEYIFNKNVVKKIEFYGKVMDWHTKWSDEIRNLYHINFLNRIPLFLIK